MNQHRHLSSQEISDWVLGDHSPEAERHVQLCPACNAELTRMFSALTHFRGAVHEWSHEQYRVDDQTANVRQPAVSWMTGGKFAWACALVIAFVLVSVSTPWQWNQKPAEVSITDAKLLSEIDTELSRSVPGPMEPLANLVAWDGSTSDTKNTSSKNLQ